MQIKIENQISELKSFLVSERCEILKLLMLQYNKDILYLDKYTIIKKKDCSLLITADDFTSSQNYSPFYEIKLIGDYQLSINRVKKELIIPV
jgi:hypothetical protein